NIRELEGALVKVQALHNMHGTMPSADTISSVIAPSAAAIKNKSVMSIDKLIDVVANYYRVNSSELLSSGRSQDLALPRHIAMFLANDMLKLSFPRIGKDFGGRKHSSVIHAYKKIKDLVSNEPEIAHSVQQIRIILDK